MSAEQETFTPIRRPLVVWYIGRPASLYIDAMAKRGRTHAKPASSASGTAEQPKVSEAVFGRISTEAGLVAARRFTPN